MSNEYNIADDQRILDEKPIYYVYGHFYKDWPDIPFLIGKGKNGRAHAKGRKDRNNWWFKLTNKYDYDVRIIYDKLDEYDAFAWEIMLIWVYGRRDRGLGPLLNLTDGGDGSANPEHSVRMKGSGNPMFGISLPAHSGSWKKGNIPWNLNKERPEFDDDWKQNMRDSHLGMVWIKNNSENQERQIKENDLIPAGWVFGRLFHTRVPQTIESKNKNSVAHKNLKLYHNTKTGKIKMFKNGEAPDDWALGRIPKIRNMK